VQPIAVTPAGPITLCQGQSVTLSAATGLTSYLWTPGNIAGQNLTVTAAGTYSVTAQTAQGCPAASAQVVVTLSNTVQPIAVTPAGPISICPGQTTTLNAEAGFNSYVWSGGAGSGQSITVSTAGNYSVTATTAQGCPAASAIVSVTVDNNQTFTLVENGPTALCNGEQLILSVPTGFTGVNWSNAATSNSITVTAPGSFSATATSASGCASTSNTVEVTSGSAPVASFTAEQINNFNTIFTNTSNGGSTYFWNFGNGNTSTGQNATFNFNIEGNYTVSLIVTNACGSDTVTQQVAIIKLSINQIATQINLTVSPNPTQGEILISADLPGAEIIKTLIVNTLGQIVMTENWNYFPGSKYLVDVNRLAVGNYVLLLETSKGRAAKTIIKN
jgi:PKD repeat protein